MPAEKLSISLDDELAQVVRDAAAEEGVSVSAWLSEAAKDRIRNRLLRLALDDVARDAGPMADDERERLVAAARRGALATRPRRARGA